MEKDKIGYSEIAARCKNCKFYDAVVEQFKNEIGGVFSKFTRCECSLHKFPTKFSSYCKSHEFVSNDV